MKSEFKMTQEERTLGRFVRGMYKRIEKSELFGAMEQNAPLTGRAIADVVDGWGVYFLVAEDRQSDSGVFFVKIGITSGLPKRITAIRTSCPLDLTEVYFSCVGRKKKALQTERELHQAMKAYSCSGEWFRFDSAKAFECAATTLKGAITQSFDVTDFMIPENIFFYGVGVEENDAYPEVRKFVNMVWLLNAENAEYGEEKSLDAMLKGTGIRGGEYFWEDKHPEVVGHIT